MIEVRDDTLYMDGKAIANEQELLVMMEKSIKYDEQLESIFGGDSQ